MSVQYLLCPSGGKENSAHSVCHACLQLPEVLTLPHWFQAELVSDSQSVWHKAGIFKESAQTGATASPFMEGCIEK